MDARQTTIYTALLISCLIVGILIAFFVTAIIRQQRRNLQLYRQAVAAEIRTLEQERARMAADLHDDLGPLLAAIKFKLGSLKIAAADRQTAAQIDQHIDNTVRRIREIAQDLLPVTLQRRGLVPAIKEFLEQFTDRPEPVIHFTHRLVEGLSEEQQVHVYRMVTEIIHNTLRHASARQLLLELAMEEKLLILRSADDGRGFDSQQLSRQPPGRGLGNILNRAELLGGQFYLESAPGAGTRYHIEIPLNSPRV